MTSRMGYLLLAAAAWAWGDSAWAQTRITSVSPSPVPIGKSITALVLNGGPFRHGQSFVLRDKVSGLMASLPEPDERSLDRAVIRYRFGEQPHAWSVQVVGPAGVMGEEVLFAVGDADLTEARAGLEAQNDAAGVISQTMADAGAVAMQRGTGAAPPAIPSVSIEDIVSASLQPVGQDTDHAVTASSLAGDSRSAAESIAPAVSDPTSLPIPNKVFADGPSGRLIGREQAAYSGARPSTMDTRRRVARVDTDHVEIVRDYEIGPLDESNIRMTSDTPPVAVTNANDQIVRPEVTVPVIVSNRDVNRVACGSAIQDSFWSQERPVKISTRGENLFVKILARKVGDRITLLTEPVDLHIICGDAVYTLVLKPRDIDSVTVRLVPAVGKAVRALNREWSALPLEQRIQKFTLMMYRNDFSEGFEKRAIDEDDARRTLQLYDHTGASPMRLFPDLAIRGAYDVYANGTGLKATEYRIAATHGREFQESDFMNPAFGDVVGITIDPLEVRPGEAARLIVVSRSVDRER